MLEKKKSKITFWVITIFPQLVKNFHKEGVIRRALQGPARCEIIDLRSYSQSPTKRVDGRIFGGAPGMLFSPEPLRDAISAIGKKINPTLNPWSKLSRARHRTLLISFSPAGKSFSQKSAEEIISKRISNIIMICGRYEGIDARIETMCDEKWRIGECVVSGGELPAGIVIDAICRLLPGTLGNADSLTTESQHGFFEAPQFTRPEKIKIGGKSLKVPDVLLSGNHAKIEKWKKTHSGKLN